MEPATLGERITIALAELRKARDAGDLAREFSWASMFDRLLDRYSAELKQSQESP